MAAMPSPPVLEIDLADLELVRGGDDKPKFADNGLLQEHLLTLKQALELRAAWKLPMVPRPGATTKP